jgi:hypothetical protein
LKDVVDGGVGLVVCGFEFAVGLGIAVGLVVEEAVGERATELPVEQDER